VYAHKGVPGVRIPLSPPVINVFVASRLRGWPKAGFPNFYIHILFVQFDFAFLFIPI
jgi:hypothetical protein